MSEAEVTIIQGLITVTLGVVLMLWWGIYNRHGVPNYAGLIFMIVGLAVTLVGAWML